MSYIPNENFFEYDNESMEYFLKMLADYQLNINSLPMDMVNRLRQVNSSFFSTNGQDSLFGRIFNLNFMKNRFDILEKEGKIIRLEEEKKQGQLSLQEDVSHVYYFASGIVGRASPDLLFQYLLITPSLRIAISLPFNDVELNEHGEELDSLESQNINFATQLIEICQHKIFPLEKDETKKLSFMLTEEEFYYTISDAKNNIIVEGDEIELFLDNIMKYSAHQEVVQQHLWIRV